MTAQELKFTPPLPESSNLKKVGPNKPYILNMLFGRVFPTTKRQTCYFIEERIKLAELTRRDIEETVEPMLQKHGFRGNYRMMGCGRTAVLTNHHDLYHALLREYATPIT